MKPLVCFYKDEHYLFSKDYQRLECKDQQPLVEFLKQIEKQFAEDLKVIQLNFEFDNQNLFSDQKPLYPSAKASVFILKKYGFKTLHEIATALHPAEPQNPIDFRSLISKENFIEKTKYVLNQIKKGRIYQANLTAPLQATCEIPTIDLFFHFQSQFSGAYKALLPLAQADLHCFSPELFLQQEKGRLVTRPIKGSLHHKEDFNFNLLKNEKEEAELSMIVDLLRNDLNSLSENHSSKVTAHREKMQLGYIQHTFSEVSIQNNLPLSSVLEKALPGGSISGCPKIESLKVIREVEDYKRQIYTGSLGWWKKDEFCLNIIIRSLIQAKDQLYYHAGCGIVYDSDPEAEWQEFLLKTGALNVQ